MIPRMFFGRGNCSICYLFLLLLAVKVIHVSASSCLKDEFSCASGASCIHQRFVCDKDSSDCDDGSDESNCTIRTCLQTEYKCGDGRCILKSWMCDQYADCSDGSDEHNCNTTCPADTFTCYNGYCLPSKLRCDGDNDCIAGEDEKECTNKTKCSSGFFQCKTNSNCIDINFLCDGDDDCGDNSDETNCGKICKPGTFTCKSGSCISGNLRCNGKPDCTDGSDEDQCPQGNSPKCFNDEFKCSSGECVLKDFECDGDKDCGDGSDEHCGKSRCDKRTDRCDNNKCILKYKFCNGNDDCGDNSDEKNERCGNTTSPVTTKGTTCKVGEYQCKSLKCINKTKVCDGNNDCPDKDDESSCSSFGINECKIKNGGCSQLCNDTDSSFYCSCKPGYKLKNDSKTCEDIDECKIIGKCSQRCKNKLGSYSCWCIDGYQLAPRGKRCLAKGKFPYLLVAVGMDIRNVSTDGTLLKCLVGKNVKDVVAVAVHYKKKVIFWSDLFLGTISMAPIGGNGKDAKVLAKSGSPRGLSLDWVAEKLYWINVLSKGSRIEVAELDGSHHKVLISNITGEAHTIVVDPARGYIYWTNPSIPSISRAHMDGHNIEAIVKTNLRSPTGLTIDVTTEKLYWLDSKTHSIEFSDLNGNNRHSVVTHNVKNPFAIAVFEDKLYWTESVSKTVISVNKFTGVDRRVVIAHENISSYIPKGILIDHLLTQPDVPNNCKKNDCSHLCLLNPKGYRCACPNNGVLSPDKKTCNMHETPTGNPTQSSSLTTKHFDNLTTSSLTTKQFDNLTTIKAGSPAHGPKIVLIGVIAGVLIILLIIVVLFVVFYRKRNNSRKMEIRYNTQLGVDIQPSDAKKTTEGKKDVMDRDTYIKFANKNFKDFDDDDDDDDDDNNYGEKQPVLKRDDGHVKEFV